MINTINFAEPTFKGVSLGTIYNILRGTEKKTTVHEFPNKNRAYVEEQGLTALKIDIQGRIFTQYNDDDVKALDDICTEEGSGELIYKRYTYQNMVCTSIKWDEPNREFGYQGYSLSFIQTETPIFPLTTNTNIGYIQRLKDKIFGDNKTALTAGITSVKNKIIQAQKLNSKIQGTATNMLKLAKTVQNSASVFSEFTKTLNVFVQNTATLIESPSVLADSIALSLQNLEIAFDGAEALFNGSKTLVNFSGGNQNVIGSSSVINEVKNNENQINDFISTTALAQCYFAAVNIEYNNVQELESNREFLENTYAQLNTERLNEEVYITITELRVISNQAFDVLSLTLPSINKYDVTQRPLINFVYGLYGNIDNLDLTSSLNDFRDCSAIKNTVLALGE